MSSRLPLNQQGDSLSNKPASKGSKRKDYDIEMSSPERLENGNPALKGHDRIVPVTRVGVQYPSIFTKEYWTTGPWFEKEPGLVEDHITQKTHKHHFFGEEKDKILTYNGYFMRHCITPFISPDISVCFNLNVWLQHVVFLLYAVLSSFFWAENYFPDTEMGSLSQAIPACPDKTLINRNMCKFEVQLSSAKGEFRFLIAFVLAGFVAAVIGRWKEIRTNYASLCGNTRNLLLNANSILPIKRMGDITEPRKTATRYILMAFELAVLKSRGHMDSPQGKAYLEELSLLEQGEWESMIDGDRHTTVLYWVQSLITNFPANTHIDPNLGAKLCGDVSTFRAQANDMMSCLNRDFPFAYVALCGLLVKLNVFIFSTWKAVEWSIWIKTFGYDGMFWQLRFWSDILTLFVWNISYMALYDLGYYLGNPFGNRRVDCPHETIAAGLHKLGRELSNGDQKVLPPALMRK